MPNVIQALGLLVHGTHATERASSDCAPVISIFATDDQTLLRLTQQLVIAMYKLDLRIVRLRSRVSEENFVEMRRGHIGESRS